MSNTNISVDDLGVFEKDFVQTLGPGVQVELWPVHDERNLTDIRALRTGDGRTIDNVSEKVRHGLLRTCVSTGQLSGVFTIGAPKAAADSNTIKRAEFDALDPAAQMKIMRERKVQLVD